MKPLMLLVGAAALVAPAAARPSPALMPHAGQCFLVRDVGDGSVADQHTLYVSVMDKARINRVAVYRIGVAGPCSVTPGSTSRSPGPRPFDVSRRVHDQEVPEICDKADLRITTRGGQCAILSMTRLTPAEIEAIPRRIRP